MPSVVSQTRNMARGMRLMKEQFPREIYVQAFIIQAYVLLMYCSVSMYQNEVQDVPTVSSVH